MDKKLIALYGSWKQRCKNRDKINTFTIEEYAELRTQLVCFYTGVTLVHSKTASDKRSNVWTLDRIDSSIGYIQGNVVVCSLAANYFKNEYFEVIGCKIREAKMLETQRMYQQIKNKLEPTQTKTISVKKLPKLIYYV
jgi:hypothetical protein